MNEPAAPVYEYGPFRCDALFAGLAVIPFESLTPELDRAASSQGFSELLVADLSKLADWDRSQAEVAQEIAVQVGTHLSIRDRFPRASN